MSMEFTLPFGSIMPSFGLGTWRMGERDDLRKDEIAALRHGFEIGVRLFDTAEMYGEGNAEEILGAALGSQRDECFVVSKVYPHNASRSGVVAACERSLQRLGTEYIDLYLLHWPGSQPLEETFAGFHALRDSGKILEFGVSNFDLDVLNQINVQDQARIATNQVYYNLGRREAEWSVLPWCEHHRIPLMAYCPLDPHGSLLDSPVLTHVAERYDASPAQIALAWLLHHKKVVAIPKTSQIARVDENFAALQIRLKGSDISELDAAYPPPFHPTSIKMA